ncbi:unnamed protein product, partial [Closterium sp. NIES-54]
MGSQSRRGSVFCLRHSEAQAATSRLPRSPTEAAGRRGSGFPWPVDAAAALPDSAYSFPSPSTAASARSDESGSPTASSLIAPSLPAPVYFPCAAAAVRAPGSLPPTGSPWPAGFPRVTASACAPRACSAAAAGDGRRTVAEGFSTVADGPIISRNRCPPVEDRGLRWALVDSERRYMHSDRTNGREQTIDSSMSSIESNGTCGTERSSSSSSSVCSTGSSSSNKSRSSIESSSRSSSRGSSSTEGNSSIQSSSSSGRGNMGWREREVLQPANLVSLARLASGPPSNTCGAESSSSSTESSSDIQSSSRRSRGKGGWREREVLQPANLVSLARLASGPPIAALIVYNHTEAAVAALLLAGASDW